MSPQTRPPAETFEGLRELWQRETEAGRLTAAVALMERALAWAREQGDTTRLELAYCSRAAVAIELGEGESYLPRLRDILMRGADPVNARLAAYDIARQYELVKDFRKALFYARIARDRSLQIGSADWIASSHNQMGNALLAQCRVDEAVEEYEQALAAMPDGPSIWRARILDNLGYCRVLQRRPRQGFALLYASLRVLRRHGARRYEVSTRLDLSFAHLEARRLPTAHRHARAALALAEEAGDADSIKNALFLLGEIASVGGAEDEAANHFGRLQREFFPQAGYLTGFLQAVNVLGLINLHA